MAYDLAGFNAAFHKGRRKGRRIANAVRRIRNRVARRPATVTPVESPTIVAGVETKRLTEWDLWHAYGRHGYQVIRDHTDHAKANVLLAVDASRVRVQNHGYVLGTAPHGAAMLHRWILWADVIVDENTRHELRRRVIVCHLPPKRYWRLWPGMIRNLLQLLAVTWYAPMVYADWNKLSRAVTAALGLRTRMHHIVGWAIGHGIRVSQPRRARVGSDHAAVVVTDRGDW